MKMYDVLKLIECGYCVYRYNNNEYVKSNNYQNIPSTAELSKDLYALINGEYSKELEDKVGDLLISMEDSSLANEALYWIRHNEEDNEFIIKLKSLCNKAEISDREVNIVVSLIPTYERAKKKAIENEIKEREFERRAIRSKFVGNVGNKISVEVKKAIHKGNYSSAFGTGDIYEFEDYDGNVFVWFTSSNYGLKSRLDSIKEVSGVIKAHNDYKGLKQNILTRCKIS